MDRFSSRQFQPGDEEDINRLYFEVTGKRRSLSEYLWQWHQSPSGSGDIWLIHDNECDGKLIGHHGVMPIRFTNGAKDLLFGKIENTMVLPEYRSKILYPRYEIRFKEQYQQRYHAIFATMGHDAAIRVRKASGYHFPAEWKTYLLGTSVTSEFACFSWLIGKAFMRLRQRPLLPRDKNMKKALVGAGFLTSESASVCPFFQSFWDSARNNHGVAPRRNREDLNWRFWINPYKSHFTFILDNGKGSSGYAIVSPITSERAVVFLDDYAIAVPSYENYHAFFNALARALTKANIALIKTLSTDDPVLAVINDLFTKRQVLCERLARKLKSVKSKNMPRFISPEGEKLGLNYLDWEITGLVFEGRSL